MGNYRGNLRPLKCTLRKQKRSSKGGRVMEVDVLRHYIYTKVVFSFLNK